MTRFAKSFQIAHHGITTDMWINNQSVLLITAHHNVHSRLFLRSIRCTQCLSACHLMIACMVLNKAAENYHRMTGLHSMAFRTQNTSTVKIICCAVFKQQPLWLPYIGTSSIKTFKWSAIQLTEWLCTHQLLWAVSLNILYSTVYAHLFMILIFHKCPSRGFSQLYFHEVDKIAFVRHWSYGKFTIIFSWVFPNFTKFVKMWIIEWIWYRVMYINQFRYLSYGVDTHTH